ncbi:MAG TPA: VapC toxin family PIN domain ribonuclease [Streptosporangiaceae bacterium]|nr:VapC toxin family PIN domain ribonuclease [Streptosporangiaceae bacterium]
MTALIVDTSAILASLDEAYAEHQAVAAILASETGSLIISPMVIAEADYMLYTRLGAAAARQFAADVAAEAFDLAEWTANDHAVALDVINRNSDDTNYIGVTDAANVVLADRYRTTRLLTLDQRHFRRLRPLWGADYFTLLPYD